MSMNDVSNTRKKPIINQNQSQYGHKDLNYKYQTR
jgi:hypothetical protein